MRRVILSVFLLFFSKTSFSDQLESELTLNYMNIKECGVDEFDQRRWEVKGKLTDQKDELGPEQWCVFGYPDESHNPQIKINGKLISLIKLDQIHPKEERFESTDHQVVVTLRIVAEEPLQESTSDDEKCTGYYTDATLTIKVGGKSIRYDVMNYQGG